MVRNNLIRGLPLFQEWSNNSGHLFSLPDGKIYTFPGVDQSGTVIPMGLFWRVLVFIKTTAGPVGTAVAGAGGAVAP